MDPTDPLEEFLQQERLEDFHKEARQTEAKPQALRTAADEIIEIIGGHPADKKPMRACSRCGGTSFDLRRPLSGPVVRYCSSCGLKSFGAARSPVWMQSESSSGHSQGAGSAYYTGIDSPARNTETHSPRSRQKAQSYDALKKRNNDS